MSNVPPPYAPTQLSTAIYDTNSSANVLHEEVTRNSLAPTPLHRTALDSLAEACSILPALEMLESAFLKDYITDQQEYSSTCYRMMMQMETIQKSIADDVELRQIVQTATMGLCDFDQNFRNFASEICRAFSLECPLAIMRLSQGMPATMEHLGAQVDCGRLNLAENTLSSTSSRLIADITGNFITCMDALKLEYNTRSALHPLLSELVVNLNDLLDHGSKAVHDFDGKSRLVNWLIRLNNLDSDQHLDARQIEEFLQDLNTAHSGFYESLK